MNAQEHITQLITYTDLAEKCNVGKKIRNFTFSPYICLELSAQMM